MNNIRAIIFDFDGVILDSVESKTRAFARLFAPWGAEAVQHMVDYHRAHGGISRFEKIRYFYREVLREPLSDSELAKHADDFRTFAFNEVVAASWIPGAKEFLDTWHTHYAMFIASGTPDGELREIIDLRGMQQYFAEVHGSPEAKESIIQSILLRYTLAPQDVVFIGDAITDYRAAVATGIRFVGVAGHDTAVFPPGTLCIDNLCSLESALATLQNTEAQT